MSRFAGLAGRARAIPRTGLPPLDSGPGHPPFGEGDHKGSYA